MNVEHDFMQKAVVVDASILLDYYRHLSGTDELSQAAQVLDDALRTFSNLYAEFVIGHSRFADALRASPLLAAKLRLLDQAQADAFVDALTPEQEDMVAALCDATIVDHQLAVDLVVHAAKHVRPLKSEVGYLLRLALLARGTGSSVVLVTPERFPIARAIARSSVRNEPSERVERFVCVKIDICGEQIIFATGEDGRSAEDATHQIVFLIHGIRTQGEWLQRTAAVLQANGSIQAYPLRYEFFDIFRFLIPIRSVRMKPVERIERAIRDELGVIPQERPPKVSIVAHSFGTYIVSQILERQNDIKIHRLLLCGSIVPDDFNWGAYLRRLGAASDGRTCAINDCGMKDIFPVLAKSITWGYGSSGRFGFGYPRVKDRFFRCGHSGFFDPAFVREHWLPYFVSGTITEGELERATTPWWISVLTVLKLRYLVLTLSLIALIVLAFHFGP
ncbi:alpha/beta fold hydrolase [Rhizobium ruizarguesonis]|uniref:hypothetical protein n=1 Tax=Rhizobium ruizarguesonis TaxID=2081791 RepID=UPI00102F8FE6|nr:hypothetical protein [Rhizobium ruizarguesonis]TAV19068.1 hypothetical protein ELI35_37840 [Rhizobium ruizarguesonis]